MRQLRSLSLVLSLLVVGWAVPEISNAQNAACIAGKAGDFSCSNVNLLSVVTPVQMGAGGLMSDMWGWYDETTGHEYALMGRTEGTTFVDVTDPVNPIVVGTLPSNGIGPSFWRDIKVYGTTAYVVADGSAGNGIQIFDLAELRGHSGPPVTFQMTAHFDAIGAAHNIVINEETGYAYVVGASGINCQGLYMLDLSDPLAPVEAGCHMETGNVSSYTHDAQCVVYHGPDADYTGREICMLSNENAVAIVDITDKNDVVSVSHFSHPNYNYVHQGWLTEDHSVFVQNDEGDERAGGSSNTRTIVWDVADLDDPVWLTDYQAAGTDIDHNLYLSGDFVYQANYTAGLRILDLSDPANPVEAGFFDTYQPVAGTPGYDIWGGAWTSYPYLRSGAVAISSFQEGLVLVRPMLSTGTDAEHGEPSIRPSELSVFPNPFADRITATIRLDRTENVEIGVFDMLGRQLLSIQSIRLEADMPRTLDAALIDLPPGVYFFTVRGRSVVLSAPIIRAE